MLCIDVPSVIVYQFIWYLEICQSENFQGIYFNKDLIKPFKFAFKSSFFDSQ